jgi:hypothetical protein
LGLNDYSPLIDGEIAYKVREVVDSWVPTGEGDAPVGTLLIVQVELLPDLRLREPICIHTNLDGIHCVHGIAHLALVIAEPKPEEVGLYTDYSSFPLNGGPETFN